MAGADNIGVRSHGIAPQSKELAGAHYEEFRGLSESEASERLAADGFNELPSSKPRNILNIAWGVVREPIFLLLVACGVIYLALGDLQEALMLLGFVALIAVITLYQENKTERTLEALRDLSSPRALVIRNNRRYRIPGREVVRGDLIVLSEGDRVPADACVESSVNLSVDESLLTGESVPVRKRNGNGETESGRPGGEDLPFVYSGTLVVHGQALARVIGTGSATEIGKIGKALQRLEPEKTLLQQETGRWVRYLAVFGLAICIVVVLLHGLWRGNWLDGILSGLTLAMAILPNELPVVLTIFLALGAWRISKRNVLTRRIPAVEMLGSASVICVDKTGTLTLNQMSLSQLSTKSRAYRVKNNSGTELPEDLHSLLEFSMLASQRDPFDPMERAINTAGAKLLAGTEHVHGDWALIRQYPLSPALLALSHVWNSPDGTDYIIAAKGAPEAIIDLCHLKPAETTAILGQVQEMAGEGLRVLGVASATFKRSDLPPHQHDFDFEFLGLIGLEDPVRPGVRESVEECYSAGIRVVMITGDYPGTALSIGRQIGLRNANCCITGSELDRMSDDELRERVKYTDSFARVVPEQKLRLVQALKSNGDIVAMTGDGVNDAPALKSAHIGIAMGGRGTDVARESSALVLLDDNFNSIVHAVTLGRRIYDNLRRAIAYTLATHIPIVGMTVIPVVMGWPLVLLPFHIAFLHLIIDPACSIVLEAEPEEAQVMRRPPRNPKAPLFGRRMLWISIAQGLAVLAIVVTVFASALHFGRGELSARTLTFATLVIANIALILTNRSWTRSAVRMFTAPNPALWWVTGGAMALLAAILMIPTVRDSFRFAPLAPIDAAWCLGAGLLSIAWFEVWKLARPIAARDQVPVPERR
jgi:Ca2+-transporting ATPase